MEQKQIDRINELAQQGQNPGGTDGVGGDGAAAALRREYIDSVLGSLRGQLDQHVSCG